MNTVDLYLKSFYDFKYTTLLVE